MVLFGDSEREILKCDHWKERYIALLSCGLFIVLYKVALTFDSVYEFLKCDHLSEIKLQNGTFQLICPFLFAKWLQLLSQQMKS